MRPFLDRLAISLLLVACVFFAGRAWLRDHPEHNPWAPLRLSDPPGWATDRKFSALREDTAECRAFLERSGIEFEPLEPVGSDACKREDRQFLAGPREAEVTLGPLNPEATCSVDAGMSWWLRHGVQPAATATLGSEVVQIEHLGTVNCRRIGGGDEGNWSEHATGNAIDISAFVLADGRRIRVREDWNGEDDAARFLHEVRDGACRSFATVLSPDYNAAHADHLHLDQAVRGSGWNACR